MKKRKLILIGLLIWNFNSVFGQNFCFTPSTSSNLSLNSSYQMRSSNNNSYCLKIYFHVIRRSNGTGGQSVESVEEAFNILNQDFNPTLVRESIRVPNKFCKPHDRIRAVAASSLGCV